MFAKQNFFLSLLGAIALTPHALCASAPQNLSKIELSKESLLTKSRSNEFKKFFAQEMNDSSQVAHVIQLTLHALEAPSCPASQKIRAYKSIGQETYKMAKQISPKETWLINPLWRDLWNSGKKVGTSDLSWRKNDELKQWEKISSLASAGEVATEFMSFSLNPLYVSEQGPPYIVAEFCPDRVFFPAKVTKDLQELEILVPLFVLPSEIISVKGAECLSLKDPLKQKDCAGVLADNIQTLSMNSLLARKCYANFGHEIEYKYMDDSPVDLTMIIRYENIEKNFLQLLDGKVEAENYRNKIATLLNEKCAANCLAAKDFIEAMDELSENGQSEVSPDLIEADIAKYRLSILKQCPELSRK